MKTENAPEKVVNLVPDVAANTHPGIASNLSWVGMEKVATPILLRWPDGPEVLSPAEVDIGVSLDQVDARGIHMSRLFTLTQKGLTQKPVTLLHLRTLAAQLIGSQSGLSEKAFLSVRFTLPILRKALLSDEQGWRQYPVSMKVSGNAKGWRSELGIEVLYSSTCPCSAALAKQVALDHFEEQFGHRSTLNTLEVKSWMQEQGLPATPHAQRSRALVEVEFDQAEFAPAPWELIDLVEGTLKTTVQTAVKRMDEQEFARLNAQNLMFCEDAARMLKAALNQDRRFSDFSITVEHQESLHAHNAVARARK